MFANLSSRKGAGFPPPPEDGGLQPEFTMSMTVACVLKTGGEFTYGDVRRLRDGVQAHLPVSHRFLCLTDGWGWLDPSIDAQPLQHNFPGWWSKLEVFSLSGPILYLDLDTVIVGDLTPLAEAVLSLEPQQILMLRRFRKEGYASGIMAWNGDWSWILKGFLRTGKSFKRQGKSFIMEVSRSTPFLQSLYRGDQDWLMDEIRYDGDDPFSHVTAAQDICPGIYSYKHHIRGKSMPEDARIIVFHGKPRPSEVTLPC